LPNARLVAACDRNQGLAESFSKQWRLRPYGDLHAMMKNHPECDIVLVLTEAGSHAPVAQELAVYGKHIVIEKPIALTLRDADKVISVCRERNIKLFVVCQNRHNLPVQLLRKAFENQRFGKVFMGTSRVRWCRTEDYYRQTPWRGTWQANGGVLVNQAIHHIDLLNWFLGDPVSVFARSIQAQANGVEVEDTGVAIVRYKSGALGTLEATTAVRPQDLEASLTLMGQNGMAEIGGFAVNRLVHWNFKELTAAERNPHFGEKHSENPPTVYGFGHLRYLKNVIDSVQNDRPSEEGTEARRALELASAMYESIEAGKEISIPFKPKWCKLGKKGS
ncbi:MAG: Gfo/Idh/MocA family oxidoreductase, partial [Puniceicoccales bacterium]|nr:Gfo/Idh/MocA family oxidoreductase [Puniceicoccales bacterium]